MKLWILGAEGLLGGTLQSLCLVRGIDSVATNRLEADIGNLEQLRSFVAAKQPTHIINCAAYTNVDRAEDDAKEAYLVNARGPKNLGIIAAERGVRCLHISTDCVFDGASKCAYKEEDPCNPLSVYGKSKRAGEEELLDQLPTACIVRTSWIFGRGGKNFLSSVLERVKAKSELSAEAEQRTSPTFAWDLATILLQLFDASGIYHFCNRGIFTRYEMALDIYNAALKRGWPLACKRVIPMARADFPHRARRPLYSPLDTTKIEKRLGTPPRSWREVLHDYLDQI